MIAKSLIVGAVCGTVIIITNTALLSAGLGYAAIGFAIIFAVLSTIYFLQRNNNNYKSGFGPVFGHGMLMTLAATVAYVGLWELYMYATDYAFYSAYAEGIVEAKKAAGVDAEELNAAIAEAATLKANLANPAFRLPMTSMEIFPAGLTVSLLAGLLLRKTLTSGTQHENLRR